MSYKSAWSPLCYNYQITWGETFQHSDTLKFNDVLLEQQKNKKPTKTLPKPSLHTASHLRKIL